MGFEITVTRFVRELVGRVVGSRVIVCSCGNRSCSEWLSGFFVYLCTTAGMMCLSEGKRKDKCFVTMNFE